MDQPAGTQALRLGVIIAALGVVFGDIGTSPIYTIQTVFNPGDPHPVPVTTDNVYGVVSLIFWSVMIIVTLTYVTLVMRADNNGEGGIMALITLLRRWTGTAWPAHRRGAGRRSGLFGAALFFGDSMITPAISVLSAVEGLKVIDPDFEDLGRADHRGDHRGAVRRPAARHRGRRAVLRAGDDRCGSLAIGACGVNGIVDNPEILQGAVADLRVDVLVGHFHIAFFALAAIVLAVTGAEALYADMGHFGRQADHVRLARPRASRPAR